jgi:type I site-specific restriction-modification system R (restriction) subunit
MRTAFNRSLEKDNGLALIEKGAAVRQSVQRTTGQHQTVAVEKVVARALDPQLARGLVWHTQGSGKTYTMIKAAELLFKANEAQKPTILLLINRRTIPGRRKPGSGSAWKTRSMRARTTPTK